MVEPRVTMTRRTAFSKAWVRVRVRVRVRVTGRVRVRVVRARVVRGVRAREVRVAFIARCRGSPNPYHPNSSPSPSPNLHGHDVARLDVPLYAGLQRGNGPTHLGDLGYGWGQSWGLPDLGIGLAPGRGVCGLRPVAWAAMHGRLTFSGWSPPSSPSSRLIVGSHAGIEEE